MTAPPIAPDELDELVRDIEDPELPHVTLGDLGIVRSVAVEGDTATVLLTPTYTGCPATEQITADVVAAVESAGYRADVRMVMSPAWTTDWITPAVTNGCAPPASLPRRRPPTRPISPQSRSTRRSHAPAATRGGPD